MCIREKQHVMRDPNIYVLTNNQAQSRLGYAQIILGKETTGISYTKLLNNGIFTDCEYPFETNPFCHASMKSICQAKTFWLNSIYCKFFIYVHKKLLSPQTSDLLENLVLFFLYNSYREHSLLKIKIKKLSTKINEKNMKNEI